MLNNPDPYKYYRIGLSMFDAIYNSHLKGRVFYQSTKLGYIVKSANKDIQKFLAKHGNETKMKTND